MSDIYLEGKVDSIRNPDGIWINTQVYREEALHFSKHGYYIADPWGSPAWFEYWVEQRRRCIEGYSVGGAKITGEHYFYLNFCPILKVEDVYAKVSKKVKDFPDFWDGDYNYFWVREIARRGILDSVGTEEQKETVIELDSLQQAVELKKLFESLHLEVRIETNYLTGGYNLIVGKSRRKGYSFKNAAVAAHNYFFTPESLTIFNAYEKKYLFPKGIMTMSTSYINFINDNTGWSMPSDVVNRTDHVKASYIQYKDGIKVERGFKSEIMAYSCKDNADANRGKDALDIIIEESGAFGTPGLLKDLYSASEDCVKAGAIQTGLITIFGTSGDMESGTADYADMHSRPLAFGLLPFNNIWDDNSEQQKVGFFHPIYWNMEGFYDKQGNSDKKAAKDLEIAERQKLIDNGATSVEIQKRMQEKPFGPSEAFGMISVNNFPVVELKNQLTKLKVNDYQRTKGIPVRFYYEDGKVSAKPILDRSVTPITSYLNLPKDTRGCPIIYEQPIPGAPPGTYKIGYDPISQDEGSSLAAIIVYKTALMGSMNHDIIVAEYVGRLSSPDDIDELALMFADYYNTKVMHENMVPGTKNYFRKRKRLDALAVQPDLVISKNVKKSKVARVYGCHLNPQLKAAGERYIKEWLLTVVDHDENGNKILTIDKIYSQRLLEELIAYRQTGNFDLISALIMVLFQVQESVLDSEKIDEVKNKKLNKFVANLKNLYN